MSEVRAKCSYSRCLGPGPGEYDIMDPSEWWHLACWTQMINEVTADEQVFVEIQGENPSAVHASIVNLARLLSDSQAEALH